MTAPKTSLSDPEYAAFAWNRYLRVLGWMGLAAAAAVAVALCWLWYELGALSLHMILATSAGVGLSVLLAAALMGLVFLSSGSGHDEEVKKLEEEWEP